MKIGGEIDSKTEIELDNISSLSNPVTLYYDDIKIGLSFDAILYNSYSDQEQGFLFGQYFRDYTFRDYGKLKNFAIRLVMSATSVAIPKSYLPRLKNSPIIPLHEIEENIDRVYGLDLLYWRNQSTVMPLLKGEFVDIGFTRSDMITLTNILDEQQVIGLFVRLPMKGLDRSMLVDFLLLVDDNTKRLLNKLIYIYTHISDFLEKKGITLKDVLEDVDLYVAVAATAATET
jgi:hypothetical protein